jgi:hypothetical protein
VTAHHPADEEQFISLNPHLLKPSLIRLAAGFLTKSINFILGTPKIKEANKKARARISLLIRVATSSGNLGRFPLILVLGRRAYEECDICSPRNYMRWIIKE